MSRYTSLTDCKVTLAKPDEAGYRASDCPGLDGFGLQKIEADGRENLAIQPPGSLSQNLKLPAYSGGGFSALGEQAEWRGKPGTPPDALIVRYKVAERADAPEQWTSYVMVASLKDTPCVVARIAPGPQQNEEARRVADSAMPCLAPGA
ncbi:hypothetical protein ABI_13400 [Asticcacaulis biprosthecium C19]|uniref:Lipoprotein n=1 Tax=Asticcacaulis biprosthecium C19 TaxID=715226 RepID=F4QI35_9CAUL|nr:hypothetical protein ABI_13400 [Asticcacaulis biprosthecium C19]